MRKQIIIPNVKEAAVQVNYNHTRESTKYIGTHIHTEYEITLCCFGKITYVINDTDEYTLRAGDVIFVNRNVPHSTIAHPLTYYIPIIFSYQKENPEDEIYSSFFDNSNNTIFISSDSDAAKELNPCITVMKNDYETKLPYYKEYVKADMQKLIAILLRYDIISHISNFLKSESTSRFLPVIKYVNENFMNHISLEDISSILHVEKSHFCRLFKNTFDISFVDYLNSVRIFHAEKLLISSEDNISDISHKCGFSTPEYFGKVFKKHKNYSPTAYKKLRV